MREVYEEVQKHEVAIQQQLGTPKLSVELVPQACWCSNVREYATPQEWDKLRKATYQRFGHVCAICRGRGPKWPVECHEIWDYSILPAGNTQRLQYLIALCPSCHQVKHFGRTQAVGDGDAALHHLAKVNGWDEPLTLWYLERVFDIWEARSTLRHWELNLDWLKQRFGMVLDVEPPEYEGDDEDVAVVEHDVVYEPRCGCNIRVLRVKG